MAFHPFRMFRKHQKAWLAGITIMAMVSFVFCSGGMDWFTRFFGGRGAGTGQQGGSDADVAKLYGKSVTRQQLGETRIYRQIANGFMNQAASFAEHKVFQEASEAVKDLTFM